MNFNGVIGQSGSFATYQIKQNPAQQPATIPTAPAQARPATQDVSHIKPMRKGIESTSDVIKRMNSRQPIEQNSKSSLISGIVRSVGLGTMAYGVIAKKPAVVYTGAAMTFTGTVVDENVSGSSKALAGAALGSAAYAYFSKDVTMMYASVSLFTSSAVLNMASNK